MRILFVGDVVGRPGRRLVEQLLPGLLTRHNVDCCIVNGENATHGKGLSAEHARQLLAAGADVITLGNHAWDLEETLTLVEQEDRLIRPLNFPSETPGRGLRTVTARNGVPVTVIQVQGQVFMAPNDCPFRAARRTLEQFPPEAVTVVDMHAEATSEKMALGYYLAGRATLVVGTHTHVQTADEQLLPGGTAYITDVGMTGPRRGIIGADVQVVLRRMVAHLPARLEPGRGMAQLDALLVEVDPAKGRALRVERLQVRADESA